MRAGILAMQDLREILVGALISRHAEPIDKKLSCLTCVPGNAASRLLNPANFLPI